MHPNIRMPEWLDHDLTDTPTPEQKTAALCLAGDRPSEDAQIADGGAALAEKERFDRLRASIAHGESTHVSIEDYPYVWGM